MMKTMLFTHKPLTAQQIHHRKIRWHIFAFCFAITIMLPFNFVPGHIPGMIRFGFFMSSVLCLIGAIPFFHLKSHDDESYFNPYDDIKKADCGFILIMCEACSELEAYRQEVIALHRSFIAQDYFIMKKWYDTREYRQMQQTQEAEQEQQCKKLYNLQ